jgi:hypothetical protein
MTYRIEYDERTRYDTVVRVRDARVFATFAEANCAAHQVNRCRYVSDVAIVEMADPEPDPPAPARPAFDVPGDLTFAAVAHPAPGEDAAARLLRLARKAVIEGCDIRPLGKGRYAVTSATVAEMVYLVDLRDQTCTCPCAGICKHLSLSEMVDLGSDGEPEVPARHVARLPEAARDMNETLEVAA